MKISTALTYIGLPVTFLACTAAILVPHFFRDNIDSIRTREYVGQSQGYNVEINERAEFHAASALKGGDRVDYSINCQLTPTNSRSGFRDIIRGSSKKHDGSFDIINGDRFDSTPSEIFRARQVLEQAVRDVATPEHLSSGSN